MGRMGEKSGLWVSQPIFTNQFKVIYVHFPMHHQNNEEEVKLRKEN